MKPVSYLLMLILLIFCTADTSKADNHNHDNEHAQKTHNPKFTKHYNESLFKITDKGLFSVEMIIVKRELMAYSIEMPPEHKKERENIVSIIIHDSKDTDVEGASIKVTPWMPMHSGGHGVLDKPVVIEKGRGAYTIKNLYLHHRGDWNLKIKIKKDDIEDNVIFEFFDII